MYDVAERYEDGTIQQRRVAEGLVHEATRDRLEYLETLLGETPVKHRWRLINWQLAGIVNPPSDLEYYEMLVEADGVCPLCTRKQGKRRLALHHNQITGEYVGLLCGRCNMGIGQFEDDPDLLEEAAKYLREHHWV